MEIENNPLPVQEQRVAWLRVAGTGNRKHYKNANLALLRKQRACWDGQIITATLLQARGWTIGLGKKIEFIQNRCTTRTLGLFPINKQGWGNVNWGKKREKALLSKTHSGAPGKLQFALVVEYPKGEWWKKQKNCANVKLIYLGNSAWWNYTRRGLLFRRFNWCCCLCVSFFLCFRIFASFLHSVFDEASGALIALFLCKSMKRTFFN